MPDREQLKPLHVVTTVFITLAITLQLLFFGQNGYAAMAQAKNTVFYCVSGGYILVMLLLLAESLLLGKLSFRGLWTMIRQSTWVQRLIFAYALFTVLSALLSEYPITSWLGAVRHEGTLTILVYCFSCLFVSRFFEPKRWMLVVLGCAVGALSLICILQLHGGNPFSLYPGGYSYADADVSYAGAYLGTIGNVDLLAAVFCVLIPILWCAILRGEKRERFFLLLPLGMALYVLIRMNVLAGFVGVFGGGALCVPVVLRASNKTRFLVFLGLAAAALAGLAVLLFFDIGEGMLHELHELLHGRAELSFGSGRIYIWKSVLKEVPKHPWFGAGPDTMANAGIAFSTYSDDAQLVSAAVVDCAHSEYLNVLYHQGIFALLAYLGALVCVLVKWVRGAAKNPVTAIAGCAVLCYAVQAMFSISQNISAPYFWLALGILECSSHAGDVINNPQRKRRKKE